MKQFFIIFLLLALLSPMATSAVLCGGQENGLNLCYPQFPGAPFLQIDMPLTQIIAWVYVFVVGISGLAAFIMIVWSGVQWMTSTGDPSKTSDAKDRIRNALLGLLLILASFVLLQTINPELTRLSEFKINPLLNPPLTAGQFEKDGVYVSDVFAFLCDGPCIEGRRSDGADYFWYDPAVWGVNNTFGDSFGKIPDLGSWSDHISEVRIVGPYGLLLADYPDFKGEVICFQGSDSGVYTPNLNNVYHMDRDDRKQWSNDGAQSLKILGFGVCNENRTTFPDEATFWSTAAPAFEVDLTLSIDGEECQNDKCNLSFSSFNTRHFEWTSNGTQCSGKAELSLYVINNSDASGLVPDNLFSEHTTPRDYVYTIECTTSTGTASDTVTLTVTP